MRAFTERSDSPPPFFFYRTLQLRNELCSNQQKTPKLTNSRELAKKTKINTELRQFLHTCKTDRKTEKKCIYMQELSISHLKFHFAFPCHFPVRRFHHHLCPTPVILYRDHSSSLQVNIQSLKCPEFSTFNLSLTLAETVLLVFSA